MIARVRASGVTHPGHVRTSNEDALLLADLTTSERWGGEAASMDREVGKRGILLAVSDGMGGAAAGEVASAVSLDALYEGLERMSVTPPEAGASAAGEEVNAGASPDKTTTDAESRLRHVVEWASEQVHEAARRPGRHGMGATLTAVLVSSDGIAYLAQVGDSRAYLLRNRAASQITKDQSYVQMLVDVGALTSEQAQHSPAKNVILQVMGQDQKISVDVGSMKMRTGDRLLVCSDGLSNMVSAERMAALASQPIGLTAACNALVMAANAQGGVDNITVVLAEIEEEFDAEEKTRE